MLRLARHENKLPGKGIKLPRLSGELMIFVITWLSQVMFFLFGLALAKQLEPHSYSVAVIVIAVAVFALRLTEVGIGDFYVINGKKGQLFTVWVLNVIKGSIGLLVVFLLSDYYAESLGVQELSISLKLVSVCFLLEGLKSPVFFKLYRHSRFKLIALIDKGSYVFSLSVGFLVLSLTQSVYSVVAVYVIYFMAYTLSSYAVSKDFTWISSFDSQYAKKTIIFSFSILFFIFVSYGIRQGMDLVVPKLVGLNHFSVFAFTFMVLIAPVNMLVYPLNRILFPLFVKVSSDKKLMGGIYWTTQQYVFFFVSSFSLVVYFFGEKATDWLGVGDKFEVELIPFLGFYAVFRALLSVLGPLLKSVNKQGVMNSLMVFELGILILCLLFLNNNIFEIVLSLFLAMLCSFIIGMLLVFRLLGFDLVLDRYLVFGVILVFLSVGFFVFYEASFAVLSLLILFDFMLFIKFVSKLSKGDWDVAKKSF